MKLHCKICKHKLLYCCNLFFITCIIFVFTKQNQPLNYQIFYMILGILSAFVIYWSLASLAAYYLVTKACNKYRKYPRLETPSQWEGFKRQDFGKWDEQAIKKGCFTTFPINFLVMSFYLITLSVLANIRKYLYFPAAPIGLFRRYFGSYACHFNLRIIEEYDAAEDITTPIVIANHVNWMDLSYMASNFRTLSFVAKKQVKKVLVINALAQYVQSIYVDRQSSKGRHQVMEQIQKRVEQFQANPQKVSPIIIYPQGTVSNGRAVLQFKNGAFQPLCPITIFSLRYQCKQFHMGMDELTTPQFSVLALSLNPILRVRKTIMSPLVNESAEQYRQRCRSKLAEMGGFKTYNSNFKNYVEYEAMIKESRRKEKQNK